MDNLRIQVDYREREVINTFTKNTPEINIETCNLPVGDIHILLHSSPILIIERKTHDDLIASIKDSRYREQKQRMVEAYGVDCIVYLIESALGWPENEMAKGAIINTLFRDNIRVVVVKDTVQTCKFIVDVSKRLMKDPSKYLKCSEPKASTDYLDAIIPVANAAKRRDMLDATTFAMLSLSLIPGVSKTIAKAVVHICGDTLGAVVSNFDPNTIKDIKLPSGKRIGPKVAERIAQFLTEKSERVCKESNAS